MLPTSFNPNKIAFALILIMNFHIYFVNWSYFSSDKKSAIDNCYVVILHDIIPTVAYTMLFILNLLLRYVDCHKKNVFLSCNKAKEIENNSNLEAENINNLVVDNNSTFEAENINNLEVENINNLEVENDNDAKGKNSVINNSEDEDDNVSREKINEFDYL